MSRARPINWRLIKDTLVRWVTGATGVEVTVWGNQNAPQPAYPYVSLLKLPSPTELGALDDEQWTEDGELQIVGQREFGISMQVHVGPPENVDPDCDADTIANAALSALALPATKEDFRLAGLALRDRGQPQPLDLLVGSTWISRALVDLRFGIVSVLNPTTSPPLDEVGFFDKVSVSSTITGLANPGGPLDLDDELMDPNA
jgi:hypothetical protein